MSIFESMVFVMTRLSGRATGASTRKWESGGSCGGARQITLESILQLSSALNIESLLVHDKSALPCYFSMRQSVAALRQSHAPTPALNAAASAKLLEKKKEFEAVVALERASTQFLKRIEGLGDDFDVIADAGIGLSQFAVKGFLHRF